MDTHLEQLFDEEKYAEVISHAATLLLSESKEPAIEVHARLFRSVARLIVSNNSNSSDTVEIADDAHKSLELVDAGTSMIPRRSFYRSIAVLLLIIHHATRSKMAATEAMRDFHSALADAGNSLDSINRESVLDKIINIAWPEAATAVNLFSESYGEVTTSFGGGAARVVGLEKRIFDAVFSRAKDLITDSVLKQIAPEWISLTPAAFSKQIEQERQKNLSKHVQQMPPDSGKAVQLKVVAANTTSATAVVTPAATASSVVKLCAKYKVSAGDVVFRDVLPRLPDDPLAAGLLPRGNFETLFNAVHAVTSTSSMARLLRFTALAEMREQERGFGPFAAIRKFLRHENDGEKNEEEEDEKEEGQRAELIATAVAQFVFAGCAVPLTSDASSIAELEGEALQFQCDPPNWTVSKLLLGKQQRPSDAPQQHNEQQSKQQHEIPQMPERVNDAINSVTSALTDLQLVPRAVFPLISWVPHRCIPNCIFIVTSGENASRGDGELSEDVVADRKLEAFVIACKDIEAGEEISINRAGGFLVPPSMRTAFCGGVVPFDAKVTRKEQEQQQHQQQQNQQPSAPLEHNFVPCDFCNGPLGDCLEFIICPRCSVGCVPVDGPSRALRLHGMGAKCCGMCTGLLPCKDVRASVLKHIEIADEHTNSSSGSRDRFKAVRILHSVLKGVPLIAGGNHLRLRLCFEIVFAGTGAAGGIANIEDVARVKEALAIIQETVEKIVPTPSPIRAALWMKEVHVRGIAARLAYSKEQNPHADFSVRYFREKCPNDFAEARDRLAWAFEMHSSLSSTMEKARGEQQHQQQQQLQVNALLQRFMKCFENELKTCGVAKFEDIVEMMRH